MFKKKQKNKKLFIYFKWHHCRVQACVHVWSRDWCIQPSWARRMIGLTPPCVSSVLHPGVTLNIELFFTGLRRSHLWVWYPALITHTWFTYIPANSPITQCIMQNLPFCNSTPVSEDAKWWWLTLSSTLRNKLLSLLLYTGSIHVVIPRWWLI